MRPPEWTGAIGASRRVACGWSLGSTFPRTLCAGARNKRQKSALLHRAKRWTNNHHPQRQRPRTRASLRL
ncbi:hypothetical protein CMEL01_05328 [Colletotrichum melonis]|uniref:Uncharacterized protein n=1 Tax=Colletotrichum melonis TaxID=1209925 RepID=A0AAI9UB14_9PEZI|nr:hypothetical protein CMEL01_05328 [Colletotrichum melonis]